MRIQTCPKASGAGGACPAAPDAVESGRAASVTRKYAPVDHQKLPKSNIIVGPGVDHGPEVEGPRVGVRIGKLGAHPALDAGVEDGRDLVGHAERGIDDPVALVRIEVLVLALAPEVGHDLQIADATLEDDLGLELELALVLDELSVEAHVERPLRPLRRAAGAGAP